MTNSGLPPGWYEDEQGASRYWDGAAWLRPSADAAGGDGVVIKRPSSRRWIPLMFGVAILLVVLGTSTYFVLSDRSAREAEVAASVAAVDRAEREAETQRLAEAAEVKRAADEESARLAVARQEVAARRDTVVELEKHVLKTAKERHRDGYYSEKIILASCMPVTGSSIEELDETSTSFSCMAVTKENKDDTYSGYTLDAVVNWNTGEMTWG